MKWLVSVLAGSFIGSAALLGSPVIAQAPLSAFSVCIDRDGEAGLCSVQSEPIATGYSVITADSPNLWTTDIQTFSADETFCHSGTAVNELSISLFRFNLAIGDRIEIGEFSVSAFDETGRGIPNVPVRLEVMAQEGMLRIDSAGGFLEIVSFGVVTFLARSNCPESSGRENFSIQFTVKP